jgi:hypothetical protein
MAKDQDYQAEWMKPQRWPERRKAPGYPRRWLVPTLIIAVMFLPLALVAFSRQTPILGWVAVGLFVTGYLIVVQVTLRQFRCPACGQRLPMDLSSGRGSGRGFLRYHCQNCNVIWLTGIGFGGYD